MTTFLRLLKETDKASALEASLRSYSQGEPNPERTFRVNPDKFRKVPNTPFAYWVDDSIRDLFQKLPPFESEGRTVRVGLQTGDDFRFVRAWWEVDADRRLDPGLGGAPDWKMDLGAFQAWCRNRTRQGKYWVPFAKGGEYSPYYSDIHLVVNWKDEGEEIKNFADPKTGKTYSRPQNTEYYFRPGVTWPVRASRFTPWPLFPGSIFSVSGYALFFKPVELQQVLCILNSKVWDYLFKMFVERFLHPKFLVGVIKNLIWPKLYPKNVPSVEKVINSARYEWTRDETSHNYCGPQSNQYEKNNFPAFESESLEVFSNEALLISEDNKERIEKFHAERFGVSFAEDEETEPDEIPFQKSSIIDHVVGTAFGRWDIRLSFKDAACRLGSVLAPLPIAPPTMLSQETLSQIFMNNDEIDYPIVLPRDGILVDDPGHLLDLGNSINQILVSIYGNQSGDKEQEIIKQYNTVSVIDLLGDPKKFFASHLIKYTRKKRKAPIYWPLSTKSGGYTVWVYYPRLTDATLYAVHELARKKAEVLDLERAELAGRSGRSRAEQQRFDWVSRDAVEVRDFAQEVLRIAGLPYKPDHDDGVPICAAPLYGLFRHSGWSKYLKGIWEELQEGKYDWAHLAYALWPDRVREKARTDRSLAIAHGLEDLR